MCSSNISRAAGSWQLRYTDINTLYCSQLWVGSFCVPRGLDHFREWYQRGAWYRTVLCRKCITYSTVHLWVYHAYWMSTLFLALCASCSTLTLIRVASQNVVQGMRWTVYHYKHNRMERLCIGNVDTELNHRSVLGHLWKWIVIELYLAPFSLFFHVISILSGQTGLTWPNEWCVDSHCNVALM